ncbi:S-layer homology domain-containing protein [Solibacillus silvestris]|uniref:S-layer homology domain-containing protein n=1 Tax=Solibacillus silvestris TaxID=76853 RepID=UPI003F7D8B44
MNKRRQSMFLKATTAATLAASAVTVLVPAASEASTFADVQPSHQFFDAIKSLSDRGIINGYEDGTFKPDQNLTRGHAAKIIAGMLDLDTSNVNNPNFKDIAATHQYYGAIAALKQEGIIDGYEDGTFRPGASIERNHVAKIIAKALNLTTANVDGLPFTDVHPDYKEAIAALFENNVTTGKTPALFGGSSNVTRGQMAAFIKRAEKVVDQGGTEARTINFKVTDYSDESITVEGKTYPLATAVKTIFTEANRAALTNATITATMENGAVTKVSKVILNNAGSADGAVVFDAVATLDSLVINAGYVTVKNVTVTGNVTATSSVAAEFEFDGATLHSDLIIDDAFFDEIASIDNAFANDGQKSVKVKMKNTPVSKVHVMRNNVSVVSDSTIPEVVVAPAVAFINLNGLITKVTVQSTAAFEITGTANIGEILLTTAVKLALNVRGTINVLMVQNPATQITVGEALTINELWIPARSTAAEIVPNYKDAASQIIKIIIMGTTSGTGNDSTVESGYPNPISPAPSPGSGENAPQKTVAILFAAKAGSTMLDGATIKVYSDESRTIEVKDPMKVAAGTYYYTVSKSGYITVAGSVEVKEASKVVEVHLVAIETPKLLSLTARVGDKNIEATGNGSNEFVFNVTEGTDISEIVATFNKVIQLPLGTEAIMKGNDGSEIRYGTAATSPDNAKAIIIKPAGNSGTASLAGTFTVILNTSSGQLNTLVDIDGNEFTIPTINLNITP